MSGYFFIGLHKKLDAAAKQRDCERIGEWQKSIVNHLYWCIVSTPSCDFTVVKAKWLSLDNHVHNVHTGHGDGYPECGHDRLYTQRRKKWFKRRK